jgi:hypothetical protein
MVTAEGRPAWSWRRKLLLQLALLPIALVAIELAVRASKSLAGEPYSAEGARTEIESVLLDMTATLPKLDEQDGQFSNIKDAYVLHPYYGFTAKLSMDETVHWNERFHAGVPDDAYVLMVLGGSVAGKIGHGLPEALENDPRLAGREVIIVNLGRGANRQPQQLVRLMFMLGLDVVPDAVLNVDGFNEAAFSHANVTRNDTHPFYPYWPRWGHLALDSGPGEAGLVEAAGVVAKQNAALEYGREAAESIGLKSAVIGPVLLRRFNALAWEWTEAQEHYAQFLATTGENESARGPRFVGNEDEAMDAVVRVWLDCSVAIASYCKTRGIKYVHALQPTLYDAGSKPLTEVEKQRGRHAKSYRQGVMLGYPKMRAAGPQLVEAGVQYIDLSMRFQEVEDEIYIDYCHFNSFGNNLVVADLVEELLN